MAGKDDYAKHPGHPVPGGLAVSEVPTRSGTVKA